MPGFLVASSAQENAQRLLVILGIVIGAALALAVVGVLVFHWASAFFYGIKAWPRIIREEPLSVVLFVGAGVLLAIILVAFGLSVGLSTAIGIGGALLVMTFWAGLDPPPY